MRTRLSKSDKMFIEDGLPEHISLSMEKTQADALRFIGSWKGKSEEVNQIAQAMYRSAIDFDYASLPEMSPQEIAKLIFSVTSIVSFRETTFRFYDDIVTRVKSLDWSGHDPEEMQSAIVHLLKYMSPGHVSYGPETGQSPLYPYDDRKDWHPGPQIDDSDLRKYVNKMKTADALLAFCALLRHFGAQNVELASGKHGWWDRDYGRRFERMRSVKVVNEKVFNDIVGPLCHEGAPLDWSLEEPPEWNKENVVARRADITEADAQLIASGFAEDACLRLSHKSVARILEGVNYQGTPEVRRAYDEAVLLLMIRSTWPGERDTISNGMSILLDSIDAIDRVNPELIQKLTDHVKSLPGYETDSGGEILEQILFGVMMFIPDDGGDQPFKIHMISQESSAEVTLAMDQLDGIRNFISLMNHIRDHEIKCTSERMFVKDAIHYCNPDTALPLEWSLPLIKGLKLK